MTTYIVIGICIFLLLAVVYISAKPISMGIEARRNIKETINDEDIQDENDSLTVNPNNQKSISDEIIKLEELKKKCILTDEEYKQAKKKLLS